MISENPQGAVIRIGKVVKSHVEDHSLDIVMLDNGARYHHVPTMSASAGTRAGRVDLPDPDIKNQSDPWAMPLTETFDIIAVVAMTSSMPVCLGYIYPQVNQLAMKPKMRNLRIERHNSDLYSVSDGEANTATHHPWGAYFSIGTGSGNPNIPKASDFDEKWQLSRNKRNVAKFTQYTPNKEFKAGDNNTESDGTVIGHGRSDISPQKITLDVVFSKRFDSRSGDYRSSSTVMDLTDGVVASAFREEATQTGSEKMEATLHLDMTGRARIKATSDIIGDAGRNIALTAEGEIRATAGGSINATADGTVRIKGSAIYLN